MTTLFSDKNIVPVTELEQSAFCQTEGNLRTKTLEEEFNSGGRWQKIPTRYLKLTPEELDEGIKFARAEIGSKALVLGHHYQRDDVFKYSDVSGDSFKLSKIASENNQAKWIIFCGVHFMAETADILTSDDQNIILPNLAAGCSMADMAKFVDVKNSWSQIENVLRGKYNIIPITYMNSSADIKSLCGENGGLVCTSSNAMKAYEWVFDKGEKILFLPDQHLGRNTAKDFGINDSEIILWDPYKKNGGLSDSEILNSKVILWKGHCSVHTRFSLDQIKNVRKNKPNTKIIVHPECTNEVVKAADINGSTELILDTVIKSPPGSSWAIGTEINMVNRLAKDNPDKDIFCLDSVICPCATMYRIHPAYLLWVLEGIMAGVAINRIKVDDDKKYNANIALERMLALGGYRA